MALGYLTKAGHVVREGSTTATARVRLTPAGRTAQAQLPAVHAQIATAWDERFGAAAVERLGTSLDAVLEHANLNEGLRPPPDGWRANKQYRARTDALLADPRTTLPHYPLVLHRGGWPDGS